MRMSQVHGCSRPVPAHSEKCWICPPTIQWLIILPCICVFFRGYTPFSNTIMWANQSRDLINETWFERGMGPEDMAVLTVKTRNSLGVMHPGAQHKKRPHLHRRSLFHRNVDGKRGQQKGPLGVYNGPKENLNVCSLARNSTCSWFAQFRRNQEIAPCCSW